MGAQKAEHCRKRVMPVLLEQAGEEKLSELRMVEPQEPGNWTKEKNRPKGKGTIDGMIYRFLEDWRPPRSEKSCLMPHSSQ